MDALEYPTFLISGNQIFPNIFLPEGWERIVPLFYEQGREKTITDYVISLKSYIKNQSITSDYPNIRLNWHPKDGLVNITIGTHGGLDLNDRRDAFTQHNLGGQNGIYAGFVAMKYISELLHSKG